MIKTSFIWINQTKINKKENKKVLYKTTKGNKDVKIIKHIRIKKRIILFDVIRFYFNLNVQIKMKKNLYKIITK